MITELQLTLFDSYPQAFRVSSQSKTQNVASDDTVTTESQNIRVIEADVIRPDIGVYGKTNRAILNSLEISGFDREKAITDFEGLGIEIQNNNGLAGLYKTRKQNLAQFFTPLQVCRLIVDLLKIPDNATIFDNSCGTGRMAWFLTNPRLFTGIEIEYHAYQIAQKTYPTAQLYNSSFLSLQIPEGVFDYVLVNPPFNLQLTSRDGSMIHINWEGHILSHIASLEIGCQALKKGGLMAAILPRNVWQLESTRKFHQWFVNTMSEVSRIHLPKDTFVGTQWPCTLFIFQKENSWHNDKKREYTLKHLNQTCDLLSWWSTQKLPFSNQTLCGLIAEYALSAIPLNRCYLSPRGYLHRPKFHPPLEPFCQSHRRIKSRSPVSKGN